MAQIGFDANKNKISLNKKEEIGDARYVIKTVFGQKRDDQDHIIPSQHVI